MSMDPLVPHILIEDEDYEVFTKLIEQINTDIREMIAVFPELVDVDNAPEIFLPKLSALIRYNYRYDIDEDIQREIIKRIISIYRDRGTDDSIVMAATYGNDPLWIGSHVFLPGADTNKDRAVVTHPVDSVFRHNISKFSGTHRYPDSVRWRGGTLIIQVPYLDDQIRQAIKKVVPAGLRVYFDMTSQIGTDGTQYGQVVMGEWTLEVAYELEYDLVIRDPSSAARFSIGRGRNLLSGRQLLFTSEQLEIYRGASMLPAAAFLPKYIDKYRSLSKLKLADIIKHSRNGSDAYDYLRLLLGSSSVYARITNKPEVTEEIIKHVLGPASFSMSQFSGRYALSGALNELDPVAPPVKPSIIEALKLLNDLKIRDEVKVAELKATTYLDEIIHDLDYYTNEIQVIRSYRGLPIRSDPSSARSRKYPYDGIYSGEISQFYREKPVLPPDQWYPMEAIESLEPRELLTDYSTPISAERWSNPKNVSFSKMKLNDSLSNEFDLVRLDSLRISDLTNSVINDDGNKEQGTITSFYLATQLEVSTRLDIEEPAPKPEPEPEITQLIVAREYPAVSRILPTDRYYPVSAVMSETPDGYIKDYCNNVSVTILTDPITRTLRSARLDAVAVDNPDIVSLGSMRLANDLAAMLIGDVFSFSYATMDQ